MFNKVLQTKLCHSEITGKNYWLCKAIMTSAITIQTYGYSIFVHNSPFFPLSFSLREENKLRLKYNQDMKEAKAYLLSQVMKSCLDFPKEGDAAPFVI